RGLSPTTANNAIRLIRVILADAQERGLIRAVPKVRRIREPEVLRGAKRDDVARYLAAFESASPSVRASAPFFRLIAATGLRFGDALALRVADVELGARLIRLRQRKTGRVVVVPLSEEALGAARAAIASAAGELLFTSGASTLQRHHAIARAAARLPSLTIHGLRHSFAARLAEAGLSAYQLRDVLGHSTVRMSERYIGGASREASADAARRILDTLQACAPRHELGRGLITLGSLQVAARLRDASRREGRAHGPRLADDAILPSRST
ncbi:MAG TPA: site-specific integrase, partial [Thermoanaerobaculia bacterium]|nr:site-specific integrase [Thermoanaerobaculia bacterium]